MQKPRSSLILTATVTLNLGQLRREVASIKWYHQIDLGHGVVTPGVDNSPRKLARLKLPAHLEGKTVLDVGAWDGFFSFEAEKRGAQRILATDSFSWGGGGWGDNRGFELARRTLGSRVEDLNIDVLDLAPERVGTFDVTFFLGVLYHMRHPLLALEKVAGVSRGLVVVETVVDFLWCGRPALAFYLGAELNKDQTNWFAPNPCGLVALLKAAGFSRVEIVSSVRSSLFRCAKAFYYKFRHGSTLWDALRTDRVVVHAWK